MIRQKRPPPHFYHQHNITGNKLLVRAPIRDDTGRARVEQLGNGLATARNVPSCVPAPSSRRGHERDPGRRPGWPLDRRPRNPPVTPQQGRILTARDPHSKCPPSRARRSTWRLNSPSHRTVQTSTDNCADDSEHRQPRAGDVVVLSELDRLGRSQTEMLQLFTELTAAGVHVNVTGGPIPFDTRSPGRTWQASSPTGRRSMSSPRSTASRARRRTGSPASIRSRTTPGARSRRLAATSPSPLARSASAGTCRTARSRPPAARRTPDRLVVDRRHRRWQRRGPDRGDAALRSLPAPHRLRRGLPGVRRRPAPQATTQTTTAVTSGGVR
ncbi:recombinase family protein [Kribbella sp. HUAS MG21]|uniref:recombinase family protein n=1 Tax=Kribbella sp. HUAS MG21 TaxID=3160966 RepID=UPI00330630F2